MGIVYTCDMCMQLTLTHLLCSLQCSMSVHSHEEEDVITPENTSPLSGGWMEEKSLQGKGTHKVN